MSYLHGVRRQSSEPDSEAELAREYLLISGTYVLKQLLSPEVARDARELVIQTYRRQLSEFECDNFDSIDDSHIARGLAMDNLMFASMATNARLDDALSAVLGREYQLLSQNGIINPNDVDHYQSSWHRDLNYQHWVSSQPSAISVLIALDPFTSQTGATQILEGTQRVEAAPSVTFMEGNARDVVVEPGDAIMFDSMIFHRAGANTSPRYRVAVNHIFGLPILRQQFAFSKGSAAQILREQDSRAWEILGGPFDQPTDPFHWRAARLGGVDGIRPS